MKLNRVVVTGLGSLTPIGNTIEKFWSGLVNGESGAAQITHFNPENFKTQFACELKNLDLNDHLDRKEIRKYDNYTSYALIAVKAIQDSGLNLNNIDKNLAGVIWGSGVGGIKTFSEEIEGYVLNQNTKI